MNDPVENPLKLSNYRFETFFNVYEDTDYSWLFYNILKSVNIIPADDPSVEDQYIVKGSDTWVYISYKFYSTMSLWWLICEYNGIKNPTQFPEPGTILRILKPDYIYLILDELHKQFNR